MSSANSRWRTVSTNDHSPFTRSSSNGAGTLAACATASSHIASTTAQAAAHVVGRSHLAHEHPLGVAAVELGRHVGRDLDVVDDDPAHPLVAVR